MLPDVGIVKYISNVTFSWHMLTWVARMSWYTPPCSYTFHWLDFPCSYLIGGTIPTSLLVLGKSIFTLLLYIYMYIYIYKSLCCKQCMCKCVMADICIVDYFTLVICISTLFNHAPCVQGERL